MKKIKNILYGSKRLCIAGCIVGSILFAFACSDLDLAPLSTATSENWYQTIDQYEMAVNNLYRLIYWNNWEDGGSTWFDEWSGDMVRRTDLSFITSGALSSTSGIIGKFWRWRYQAIQNSNRIIEQLEGFEMEEVLKIKFEANAKFNRAANYSKLIFHWGDVPFYTGVLSPDEAFELGRKDKYEILQEIYKDFDYAAENLPLEYSGGEFRWATKGAALALKARIALYMEDYAVARDAAKAVMDLGIYELYPDYQDLFSKYHNAFEEIIFAIPRSITFDVTRGAGSNQVIPRTNGGFNVYHPSWQLLASFLCTDGLPIDESPLFDPNNPFKNRDPRCTKVLVEFGTELDGIIYEPHPDSLVTLNVNTGEYVENRDTRGNQMFAAFNGLTWRKWVHGEVSDFQQNIAMPKNIVVRYADVLLYYAEAKIELNEIDQSVLDAINNVRARAYNQSDIPYPEVTTMDQSELRYQLRVERRMEFPFEGLRRYYDIIRWGIADKLMNMPTYGILSDPADIRERHVEPGLWFWGDTPPIDEDGIALFEETEMFKQGAIRRLANRSWPERQNLWPIPSSEVLINPNLTQNPEY